MKPCIKSGTLALVKREQVSTMLTQEQQYQSSTLLIVQKEAVVQSQITSSNSSSSRLTPAFQTWREQPNRTQVTRLLENVLNYLL